MHSGIQGPAARAYRPPGLRPTGENFEFWQLWDAPGPERVHAAFRGQLDQMLRQSELAARRLTAAGDLGAGLRARVNAGLARLHLGDGPGASAVLTAAFAAAREQGAGWEEGYACYALGAVYRAAQEAGLATARLGAAERLFRDRGDVRAGGHARLALAVVTAEAGDAGAREHLLAAVEAFRVAGARGSALTALWMLSALETGGRSAGGPRAGGPRVPGFAPTGRRLPAARREQEPARPETSLQSLTRREREVALLVASGLTNRQIAERMSIAERTVDTHVQRILAKSNCATRVQVAVLVAAGYA
ncbi:LuxR C-terminal-related transcriptional regulator [Streptomyces sp. NPDC048710]|uniref:helix-turn-helix transcriptional regulator n=1 Tax=unclassified Streptomyces TaxID=2593676 RepID=UPI0037215365